MPQTPLLCGLDAKIPVQADGSKLPDVGAKSCTLGQQELGPSLSPFSHKLWVQFGVKSST